MTEPRYSIPTGAPVPVPPGEAWTTIPFDAVTRMSLPAGVCDIVGHFGITFPKRRPQLVELQRVRFRPGEGPNDTCGQSIPITSNPAMVRWQVNDINAVVTEGEEWEYQARHDGPDPILVKPAAAKGINPLAYAAEHLVARGTLEVTER